MLKILIVALALIQPLHQAFAETKAASDDLSAALIDYQIDKYKLATGSAMQLLFPMKLEPNHDCEPVPPPNHGNSCVDAVCKRLPSYLCDDHSDLRRIGAACAGVWEGECIDTVCNRLPSYLCDDHSDMEKVTASCKSVSQSCVSAACSKLPSYLCDDHSDLSKVGQICKGLYDGECITAICNRLPSYQCDDHSDLEQVARTCRGE